MKYVLQNAFREVFWKPTAKVIVERVADLELLPAQHIRQVRPHSFEDKTYMLAIWPCKLE